MKYKIVIVQPILSPYSIPRFEELAKNSDLEIILLIEKRFFPHRPGWNASEVKGCQLEIIDSYLIKERIRNKQKGYVTEGLRTIPFKLSSLLAKYKPDIVLVSNATELLFSLCARKRLSYKIGLIVEETTYSNSNVNNFKQLIKSFIYKKADFYIPFSDDSVSYLSKIRITTNCYRSSWSVDLAKFDKVDSVKVENIKAELNLYGKIVFMMSARLVAGKGAMNLLRAWEKLNPSIRDKLALLIIGDGPQKQEILDFLKSYKIYNVFLLGQKQYEEVVNYYHSSDIFILPTLQDLFSLVCLEAMACGLPVLTSKYNGARELIEEGKNGYLFDSNDIEDIKKILIKSYEEKGRLKEMGNIAKNIIIKYSHGKVMHGFKEILDNVMSDKYNSQKL